MIIYRPPSDLQVGKYHSYLWLPTFTRWSLPLRQQPHASSAEDVERRLFMFACRNMSSSKAEERLQVIAGLCWCVCQSGNAWRKTKSKHSLMIERRFLSIDMKFYFSLNFASLCRFPCFVKFVKCSSFPAPISWVSASTHPSQFIRSVTGLCVLWREFNHLI